MPLLNDSNANTNNLIKLKKKDFFLKTEQAVQRKYLYNYNSREQLKYKGLEQPFSIANIIGQHRISQPLDSILKLENFEFAD